MQGRFAQAAAFCEGMNMAKTETTVRNKSSFEKTVKHFTDAVMNGSYTATLEESIDMQAGNAVCAVRTLERYSALGGNRVSMTIVFLSEEGSDETKIVATSTGGGGLVKIVPWGENEFLDTFNQAVRLWKNK